MIHQFFVTNAGYICLILLSLIFLVRLGSQWIQTLEARLRAEEILERYDILKATTDSFSSTIGNLLANLLSDINDTNELLNKIPSSSHEGKRLYAHLFEEQRKIQSPETRELIIRAVNDSNDGIVDLFCSLFPDEAEEQSITFALCAGKVNPKIASLILNVKPKTFYVRRDRLRDMIAQAPIDPTLRTHLLDSISTPRPKATASTQSAD